MMPEKIKSLTIEVFSVIALIFSVLHLVTQELSKLAQALH